MTAKRNHGFSGYAPPGQSAHTGTLDGQMLGKKRNVQPPQRVDCPRNRGYNDAHFATFPPALIEPCIKAGCPQGGTVLDPFGGAGTTGLVADRLGRDAVLIELNPEYAQIAEDRIKGDNPLFAEVCRANSS